jgi:hypothetical protein
MRAPKYIADFAFPQMGIGGGIRSAQERPRFARQSGTRIAYWASAETFLAVSNRKGGEQR